jgi:type I restriction enzyme R subunit
MSLPEITERAFEDAIEEALLASGYTKRLHNDYDRALCLDSGQRLDFLSATQPKGWAKYQKQHGAEARDKLVHRIAVEIGKRGTLDVLRGRVKPNGCSFHPEANRFTVVRQLRYSARHEKSRDLVLFLDGLPLFTAALKNPSSGQTVVHALHQYRTDRDPKGEPFLAFARCLAHFVVDERQAYVTTELVGQTTRSLPFNRGHAGGAGNPPSWKGYATAYLWEDLWSPGSVLELVQHFLHVVEIEDDKGRKTGERRLDFPRFHQRDAVRRLVADARQRGAGRRYLIQHRALAAGSRTASLGSPTGSPCCTTTRTGAPSTRWWSSPTDGRSIASCGAR